MSQMKLLLAGFGVTNSELEKAEHFQRKYGGALEQILVGMGSLSTETLPALYSQLLNIPFLTEEQLQDWSIPVEAYDLPLHKLIETGWLPFKYEADQWIFVTTSPLNKDAQELVSDITRQFRVYLLTSEQFSILKASADSLEPRTEGGLSLSEESRLRELASEAPTVNLLNSLISRALRLRASDMHIEPVLGRGKVRFRIDGVLQDADYVPSALLLPITTRLKILSNMDIAEKRRPQDGKIEMRISGIDLDIRVSALPLNDGESVVLRFLRKDSIRYDMATLGIAPDIELQILEDLQTTAGVVLLTGPTGSGKTTSLYTFLHKLNTTSVKIITLEDPVEYQLQGINQVQVQPDIGFNFATGLRSIVRQDPDIIMLGEIRDSETASIAMQSALTGHLVFSTLHTNDAPSAYTRLLDLGIEEFLLNAALVSIVAQRLVRKLCPVCAVEHEAPASFIQHYQLERFAPLNNGILTLKQAKGCDQCNNTGYTGRVAIIEYLRCDESIKKIPKDQDFILRARLLNNERGGRTLLEDGLLKVAMGITTIDEVIRVAG